MRVAKLDLPWLLTRLLTVSLPLLVALYGVTWFYWISTGSGLADRSGNPIGGDFSYYWSASSLVLQGEPAAVYDLSRIKAVELQVFGKEATVPFPYPPTFLLLLLPFGLLPYLPSLALWLGVTLGGYLWTIRRIAPHPQIIWLALAFPGAFQNFGFGQNGFLSAVLLGGGLLLVDRRPLAAGVLFGLLTYKPHLAVLMPVALVAGRRWRSLWWMGVTCAALILASLLVLGPDTWRGFLSNLPGAVRLLETGSFSVIHKMPTVFCALIFAGADPATARILHGAVMLAGAAAMAWVWWRGASPPLRNAISVLAILLFIPHSFIYDLAILALPLAWLGWEGYTRGWRPGEKVFLILGYFTPLVAPSVAQITRVQSAPLILGALLFLAWRRAAQGSPSALPENLDHVPAIMPGDIPAHPAPDILGSKETS
ncbi:MAG: DUF2029 domain-containing protein [Deltaproteobacteria bacterium]|nr:MAG: DUF2029 domain-containing protein [Deltaproteobacteria bacterium]